MFRNLVPLAALALGLATSGCIVTETNGGSGDYVAGPSPTGPTPNAQAQIDSDATIDAAPGDGVGLFVEYGSGGHWHVFTACDTKTSDLSCQFDVSIKMVDAKATLANPVGEGLDGNDAIGVRSDGSLRFHTDTSTGLDGVRFDATPGAKIEVYLALDHTEQPRFLYWIGQGVLHTGAPTDPIDLAPSVP